MKEVYFEWYIGLFFLGGAIASYWLTDSPPSTIQWLLTMSAISLGVNSIKQFIAENKGETK